MHDFGLTDLHFVEQFQPLWALPSSMLDELDGGTMLLKLAKRKTHKNVLVHLENSCELELPEPYHHLRLCTISLVLSLSHAL